MLDIRDYDMAVTERIKYYFKNTHFIMRPTIPIKEIRDRKLLDGKDVCFPLITVRRSNCPVFSQEYNSWARGRTGQGFVNSDKGGVSYSGRLPEIDPVLSKKIIEEVGHCDAVSVVNSTFELTYYIDVICFERDNFDTMIVELQENLFRVPYIGFPNIKSDGTQDALIKYQACHFIVEEIEDTSDLENFDSGNAMYRATITTKLNAYIYRKFKEVAVEKFKISDVGQYHIPKEKDLDDGIGLLYTVDDQSTRSF